jgi:serine/threonine-protein kinase
MKLKWRYGLASAPDSSYHVPSDDSNRSDETASWSPRYEGWGIRRHAGKGRADAAFSPGGDARCFEPRPAICAGSLSVAESRAAVRARLREVPIVFIVLFGMAILWKYLVLKYQDPTILGMKGAALLALAAIAAVLWSRICLSLAWLKAIEFGIVAILATMIGAVQYRLMLTYSLQHSPVQAQMVMKNIVVFTSILIVTYGIYVPKSWRRAALVVGPLASLPFAVLLALWLKHREAMAWLRQSWQGTENSPLEIFSFDAMLLSLLAVGSSYGAHTLARLRSQVVEARQIGQYRLGRRIGSGAMGEVYLAEHRMLKRPCAIKLIRPGKVSHHNALERFEREVRVTATLSHWNTVEVFDYGRTEDGTYYYVMEYLPGMSLSDMVVRHGPLPPERVVYLLRQVCRALREAHGAGLVHRDIKPSNIFAARRGGEDDVAKLLDFGLVLPVADTGPHLSRDDQVLGTPLFMSPEQAMGNRTLDERSDIYSLGAVAYYLLTARYPFNGDTSMEVMVAHARDKVVPPSQLADGIPTDLEHIVLRCLEKDPNERFWDAHSLERALSHCDCAREWNSERAARWWHDSAQPAAALAGAVA